MGASRTAPPGRRVRALLAGLVPLVLAGCESTPRVGEVVTAQVTAQPRARAELTGGFTPLHAALRAGVVRADAERGRLVLAQCLEPDAGAPDGLRARVATLLLPEGVQAPPGALLDIDTLGGAHATDSRRHGRFVALAPASSAQAEPAAWRTVFGRARPLCRPPGLPEGRWRVQSTRTVAAWELGFAQAERARHDAFSDADFAAGRVLELRCQLKVLDGSDWTLMTWLARAAEGPPPPVGAVLRLRAGAEEGGDAPGPPAQVLGPAPGVAAPGGQAVVRCR
jgi:hypothetical protein